MTKAALIFFFVLLLAGLAWLILTGSPSEKPSEKSVLDEPGTAAYKSLEQARENTQALQKKMDENFKQSVDMVEQSP